MDSVRAQNCSLYGHENKTTPFLESLADESTLFTQARSPSIHSVSSHASMFSGLHVPEHQVTEHESSLDPSLSIWDELNKEHEYDTGLFTPNVIVSETSNLADAFETVEGPKRDTTNKLFPSVISPADLPGKTSSTDYIRAVMNDGAPVKAFLNGIYDQISSNVSQDPESEDAQTYIEEFLSWVENRNNNWAACVNLMDAHFPYFPRDEFDKWGGDPIREIHENLSGEPLVREFLNNRPWDQLRALEALYDGCIRQIDAEIRRLIQLLREKDVLERTLVIITSDHGEAFGEISQVSPDTRLIGHSWGISEVQTHVPLIIRHPDRDPNVVNSPYTLTGLPDIIREYVSNESEQVDGYESSRDVISSTYRIRPPGDSLPLQPDARKRYFGPWRAVYRSEDGAIMKHIERRGDCATVKIIDAQNSYVVNRENEGIVEDSFSQLKGEDVNTKLGNSTIDESTQKRLEELGYLT